MYINWASRGSRWYRVPFVYYSMLSNKIHFQFNVQPWEKVLKNVQGILNKQVCFFLSNLIHEQTLLSEQTLKSEQNLLCKQTLISRSANKQSEATWEYMNLNSNNLDKKVINMREILSKFNTIRKKYWKIIIEQGLIFYWFFQFFKANRPKKLQAWWEKTPKILSEHACLLSRSEYVLTKEI